MKTCATLILLAMLGGCVYQPIHVELYNVVSVENADIGVDASQHTEKEPAF